MTIANAYSVWKDQMVKVGSGASLATLMVPDGNWVIFAKLNLDNDDTVNVHTVTAKLQALPDFDVNVVRLAPSGMGHLDNAVLAFNVLHHFPGNSSEPKNAINLTCILDQAGANVSAGRLKITAINVASFVNVPSQ